MAQWNVGDIILWKYVNSKDWRLDHIVSVNTYLLEYLLENNSIVNLSICQSDQRKAICNLLDIPPEIYEI